MKLNSKIVNGIGWTSVSTMGTQGLRLLFKLILAKLLLPEDYGLIGMATVFISFVEAISELGLTSALIQKKKSAISETYFNTAFWANLMISTIGFLIIVLAVAPFAAWFYHQETLLELIPILAISVILNSFYVIPKIKLSRKMDFKPQAIIEISASLAAGILAVTMAYSGFGVWALAFNGITISVTSTLLYYARAKWLPRLQFSKSAFKDLFGFGSKVLIERIFGFLTLNIDYILIGKLIGGAALGAYTLAFILTSTFMKQVNNILNKVLYPAYSAMQDDVAQIGRYYLNLAKINNMVMAPIMLTFIAMGETILHVGFGPNWQAAVIPLKILSLAVIISSIGGSSSIVMRSMGRPDLSMKLNVVCTTFSTIPFISAGAYLYGINGAAVGILADRLVRLFLYQSQLKKLTGIGVSQLWKQVSGTLMICAFIGLVITFLDKSMDIPDLVTIFAGLTILILLYSTYIFLFEKKVMNKILEVTQIRKRVLVPLFNL